MYVNYDPDEYESVMTSKPVICHFHEINPLEPHPNIAMRHGACGCRPAQFVRRKRAPEDYAKIKADRLRKHEDEILRQAEAIKASRCAV